ncbi:MAG: hypothetical protein L0287_26215, partial [Anaerolineae bacterium]|nr:hypothetical protein [Anaerolineae bacterium]
KVTHLVHQISPVRSKKEPIHHREVKRTSGQKKSENMGRNSPSQRPERGLDTRHEGWREEKEERLGLIDEEKEMTIITTVSGKRIRLWRKKSGPKPLPEGVKKRRINICLFLLA